MTVLLVPYHLDERVPDAEFPVSADRVVTADLRGEGFWSRVAGLYDAVGDAVVSSERPVVVTGDCTVALGVVAGLQRRGVDPSVVWFDAHGDLNTPTSSISGYPGGMVLRMLLGDGGGTVAEAIRLGPVPAERVVLVDARDLDPPEVEYLAGGAVQRRRVEEASAPEGPIYLHVDLDVVDAAALPGLRFPAVGGPSLAAVRDAALRILDTGRVAAMTLACTWRPGEGAGEVAGPHVEELLAAAR